MEVYVDGQLVETVNQFNNGAAYQVRWDSPSLGLGNHSVVLKHAGPSGKYYITLDAVLTIATTESLTAAPPTATPVTPTFTPSPTPITAGEGLETVIDDADPLIRFDSNWRTLADQAGAFGASYHFTGTTDAAARFSFFGDQFGLLYTGKPNGAVMEVYLDGILVDSIDQSNPSIAYQLLWTSPLLSLGEHHVTLSHPGPTGKNYITLDAVIILDQDGAGAPTATLEPSLTPEDPTATTEPCYALAVGHSGNGSSPAANPAQSEGCSESRYHSGELVDLSGAIPDEGWEISGWQGTVNDASTSSANQVIMPANDHSAAVIYGQASPALIFLDDFSADLGWTNNTDGYFSRNSANQWLEWQVRRDRVQVYSIPISTLDDTWEIKFRVRFDYWNNNNQIEIGLAEALSGSVGDANKPTGVFVHAGFLGGGTTTIDKYISVSASYPGQSSYYYYVWPNRPDTYVPHSLGVWYWVSLSVDSDVWVLNVYQSDGTTLIGTLTGSLPATHGTYNYFVIMNTATGDYPTGGGLLDDISVWDLPD